MPCTHKMLVAMQFNHLKQDQDLYQYKTNLNYILLVAII